MLGKPTNAGQYIGLAMSFGITMLVNVAIASWAGHWLDEKLGTFYVGNLIDDVDLQKQVGTEEYDIVVANILADVIIPMAPVIPDRLKKGGYFITSGIIDFKEDEVRDAIEKTGLKVIEINHQGEWVNITAQKL